MNEDVAEVIIEDKQARNIKLLNKDLRFSCIRCSIFCCNLGGPVVTEKDIQTIKQAGTMRTCWRKIRNHNQYTACLSEKEDGTCYFLGFNKKGKRCNIYNNRPTVCRLFPFNYEYISSNHIMIKLVPFCLGLDNPNGKMVNKRFIMNLWKVILSQDTSYHNRRLQPAKLKSAPFSKQGVD